MLIDVENLKQMRAALQRRLEKIDQAIELLADEDIAAAAPAPPAPLPTAAQANQPQQIPLVPETLPKHSKVRTGARKAISILLLTGPTSSRDLAKTLVWEIEFVRQTLMNMRGERLCDFEAGDRWYLTGEGKKSAVWFQRHPEYKTYKPFLTGDGPQRSSTA